MKIIIILAYKNTSVIRPSLVRERDEARAIPDGGDSLAVHVHSHMQARRCLQLAACSGIVELGQRDTIAPDARTDTSAPFTRRCPICATRVSPLNFCSLCRQAPDILTFYQGEPQAPRHGNIRLFLRPV